MNRIIPTGFPTTMFSLPSRVREQSADIAMPGLSAEGAANVPSSEGSRGPRSSNNSMRARLAQMVDTKKVPHPPAIQFDGEWHEAATAICQGWIDAQAAHNTSTVSHIGLSKMKALEYERKNLESIPADQRLLPEPATKRDYYNAEVEAFLEAVGVEDPQAVLESFELAGTGGLHRQHATVGATISNAVGVAQVLAPDPIAKATLSGIRAIMQLATANAVLDSGKRRLRNAGTEDVLPQGRADAAPAAKAAPNMFSASSAVISGLRGAETNLRKLQQAMAALSHAQNAESPDAGLVRDAKEQVELAFAKICHQISIKAAYKASSESAKIEFRGNLGYLIASYAGTGATLGTGLLAIMTPMFISAAVTGGLGAGAVALALALYVHYQLSSGPSKDGKEKAQRAIVALVKLLVVLNDEDMARVIKRAQAYEAYRREKKAARFAIPGEKARVKEEAKARLLVRLEEITNEDQAENPFTLRQNWGTYRSHATAVNEIESAVAQESIPEDEGKQQMDALKDRFRAEHQAHLAGEGIMDAWKTPMRIRMDAASRLLKGKVARSHKRLLDLRQHPSLKARMGTQKQKDKEGGLIEQTKVELRQNLLDMFNFELARNDMKLPVDIDAAGIDLARAVKMIASIEDEDVRHLFCGDGKEQVEAINKSKILTAGEAERYTYANAGSAAVGIAVNIGIPAADLAVNTEKAAGVYHGPKFSDYKFFALSQTGAQPGAHMSAGDRAAFQKREWQPLVGVIEQEDDAVEMRMDLAGDTPRDLKMDDADVDASLDRLIEQLWQADAVPRMIKLAFHSESPDAAGPSGRDTSSEEIVVDLKTTAAYHRVQYKNASALKRVKYRAGQLAVGGRQAVMSVAGLPVQAIAQYPLKKTRAPLNAAIELDNEVHGLLRHGLPGEPSERASRPASDIFPAAQTVPPTGSPDMLDVPEVAVDRPAVSP